VGENVSDVVMILLQSVEVQRQDMPDGPADINLNESSYLTQGKLFRIDTCELTVANIHKEIKNPSPTT